MKKFMSIVIGLLMLFAVSFSLSTKAEAAEKRVYFMQIDSSVPIDRNETVDFYVPITPAPAGKKVVIDYWFTASKYNATPQQEYGIWEASFSDMKGNVYDELKGATVGLSKQFMFTKKMELPNHSSMEMYKLSFFNWGFNIPFLAPQIGITGWVQVFHVDIDS